LATTLFLRFSLPCRHCVGFASQSLGISVMAGSNIATACFKFHSPLDYHFATHRQRNPGTWVEANSAPTPGLTFTHYRRSVSAP